MVKPAFERSGFTLVEILVVMAIIALLLALIGTNFLSALRRGRDGQRKADLKNIQTQLRAYYNDSGRNPCSSAGFQLRACSPATVDNCATVSACEWGQPWAVGTTTYMTKLPKDPADDRDYHYTQIDDETYVLQACLENTNDTQCGTSDEKWCTSLDGCIYELRN